MRKKSAVLAILIGMPGLFAASFSLATEDAAREEMQRALNKEVMSKPFNPGDIKRAQADAEAAKRQNISPMAQPPAYWVPGWTCANMISYSGYSYGDYSGCIYYHHYYGRYWR